MEAGDVQLDSEDLLMEESNSSADEADEANICIRLFPIPSSHTV